MNARCLSIALCGMLFAALSTSAQKADNSQVINGHKFVDLALPSGLLWAETNIGAVEAYDAGSYYAWGETEPKKRFDQETYKYGFDSNEYGSWYKKYGLEDELTTLEKVDDAAYVNWGSSCRMPTVADFEELFNEDYCTWEWTSLDTPQGSKVNGWKVTSKKNGNWIFLPAAGYFLEDVNDDIGESGQYWSSNNDGIEGEYAYSFYHYDTAYGVSETESRYSGCPIRPVAEPNAAGKPNVAATGNAQDYKIIDGHRFVDLALPSKLLWAETNMGAETAADVGIYFAWGETEMKQKKSYDWEAYKFGTSEDDMTKYNAKDEKEIIDKEDDAAYVNWGPSCRIPDLDDFRELFDPDNCTWTWVEATNSSGSPVRVCKVTSVRNGNSIYLPDSGNYIGNSINHSDLIEEEARFWSRNVDGYIIVPAFCFMIISDETYQERDDRSHGYPIRPVAEQ